MLTLFPCVVELVGLRFFLPLIKTRLALNTGNPDLLKPHSVVLLIRTADSTGVQMFYVLQSRMLHC